MKRLAIALLTGACLAVPANADFVGGGYRITDLVDEYTAAGYGDIGTIDTDLSTITVFEFFAVFDAPATVLEIGQVSMFTETAFVDYDGTGAAIEGLPSSSGGFIVIFGEIIVDSFITINQLQDPGGTSSTGSGFPIPDFVDGANYYANLASTYAVTPESGIGDAIYNPIIDLWTVHIAQVIVENTPAGQPGYLDAEFLISTSETTHSVFFPGWPGQTMYVPLIPAPGALALLGLCVVVTRRRRRQGGHTMP